MDRQLENDETVAFPIGRHTLVNSVYCFFNTVACATLLILSFSVSATLEHPRRMGDPTNRSALWFAILIWSIQQIILILHLKFYFI